jgi:hypothetical protein
MAQPAGKTRKLARKPVPETTKTGAIAPVSLEADPFPGPVE